MINGCLGRQDVFWLGRGRTQAHTPAQFCTPTHAHPPRPCRCKQDACPELMSCAYALNTCGHMRACCVQVMPTWWQLGTMRTRLRWVYLAHHKCWKWYFRQVHFQSGQGGFALLVLSHWSLHFCRVLSRNGQGGFVLFILRIKYVVSARCCLEVWPRRRSQCGPACFLCYAPCLPQNPCACASISVCMSQGCGSHCPTYASCHQHTRGCAGQPTLVTRKKVPGPAAGCSRLWGAARRAVCAPGAAACMSMLPRSRVSGLLTLLYPWFCDTSRPCFSPMRHAKPTTPWTSRARACQSTKPCTQSARAPLTPRAYACCGCRAG